MGVEPTARGQTRASSQSSIGIRSLVLPTHHHVSPDDDQLQGTALSLLDDTLVSPRLQPWRLLLLTASGQRRSGSGGAFQ